MCIYLCFQYLYIYTHLQMYELSVIRNFQINEVFTYVDTCIKVK